MPPSACPLYLCTKVDHFGICSCGRGDKCSQQGKHPRTRNGSHDGTLDAATIRRWWKRWPTANVGICTGQHETPAQSVFVVGPDGPAGVEALAELEHWHSPLPPRPYSKTGSDGQHHLFLQPPGVAVKNRQNHRGVPIDVRGDGGLIVAPPSRNANGAYSWVVEPVAVPFPEPPAWLVEWLEDEQKPATPPPVHFEDVRSRRRLDRESRHSLLGESAAGCLGAGRTQADFSCRPRRGLWLRPRARRGLPVAVRCLQSTMPTALDREGACVTSARKPTKNHSASRAAGCSTSKTAITRPTA